jgi:hypothetical protein
VLFSRCPGEQQNAETSTRETRRNEERKDFGDGTYSGDYLKQKLKDFGIVLIVEIT